MNKLILLVPFVFTIISVKAQDCPKAFHVIAPSEVTAGDTLVFIAEVSGTTLSITFNWSISSGFIISGQGTSVIMVNTDSLGGQTTTATVELGGLSRDCMTVSSSTTEIMPGPERIMSINYTTPKTLEDSLKSFITRTDLKNMNISQTAFFYLYNGPTTTPQQLKKIQVVIDAAFKKNGIFTFQYKIVNGGKRKKTAVEMFKLGAGVKEPKPSQ
ncbi:MAG TPA: hypothetical protein VLJ68_14370 [Chitinophagaceae bacterium]|nr:hypothetical protein [Chitinophagaceae bacterium]